MMNWIVDKQTKDDLNLSGKFRTGSVYNIFKRVSTGGGERLLDEFFDHPLTDVEAINHRSSLFRYFQESGLVFPLKGKDVRLAEDFLTVPSASNRLTGLFFWGGKKLQASFLKDERYGQLQTGLLAALEVLRTLRGFVGEYKVHSDAPYAAHWEDLRRILDDERLLPVLATAGKVSLSLASVIRYDLLLRRTMAAEMGKVLKYIFELDVYLSVADVARTKGFSYAHAGGDTDMKLYISGLRHPSLDAGVPNNIRLDGEKNLLFLTGANMAGKSTIMKSLGIALYLAHIGFPVPAQGMEFSTCDGLFTSINVSDNLSQGFSHFYAEVLRVKEAASKVSSGKRMIVVFDELFKGTNVKDAYDATLAVTKSFSYYRNCLFVISTHIVEVGAALKSYENIIFSYMPTIMEGEIPRYPYTMIGGISNDRHGMMIIRKEGILEMIKIKEYQTQAVKV